VDEDGRKLYGILCCTNGKQKAERAWKQKGEADESNMLYVMYTDCPPVIVFAFRKQNTNRCCYSGPCKQHQSHLKIYIVAAERKNGGNVLKTTKLGKFAVSDVVLAFSCNVRIVKGKDTDPSDVTGILA
jgi:hypothetical protein